MALQNVKPPVIEVGGSRLDNTSPAVGDSLVFNGSLWVPGTPPVDNLLWQGAMNVWQGGGSFANLGAADTFINDGWKFGRDNYATGKITVAADSNSATPPGKSMMITCGTAEVSWTSSAKANIDARIEGQDFARLGYGTVYPQVSNLSFAAYCSSTAAGTYTIYIWYSDGGSNQRAFKFPVTLVSGWNYISQLIPSNAGLQVANDNGIRAIVGICLSAGSNLVDSQSGVWHVPDATFKLGLTGQKNFHDSTSNRLDLASFQWTVGPAKHSWIHKPFAETFATAQRYFEKSFDYSVAPAQNAGYSNGATGFPQVVGAVAAQYSGHVAFRVRKRVVPTITFYNPNAANAQCRCVSAAADCSSTVTWALSESGFTIATTTAVGSSVGNANAVHWTAEARG